MSEIENEFEAIQLVLQEVIDRLDDIAFRELRGAVARKETKRPDVERRVTRARNALLRVLPLLRADEQPGEDPG
ncbi:MAG TPA: hypothetical protein VMU99_01515 [Acidimicrobiales bacterium]|nr:hypothetical protein [Acidimicrobiales bacterium]